MYEQVNIESVYFHNFSFQDKRFRGSDDKIEQVMYPVFVLQ